MAELSKMTCHCWQPDQAAGPQALLQLGQTMALFPHFLQTSCMRHAHHFHTESSEQQGYNS